MALFARPTADISRGSWTTNSGATVNLWSALDDDPADDVDYAQSSATANDVYEARLSSVTPAPIDRLHILNYRVRKSAALGNTRGVTVALVQGSTIIASQAHPDLTIVAATLPLVLTAAQGAAITDYADLRIRFTATGSVAAPAGSRRAVWATWAQLRVPDSVDLIEDWRTRWGLPVQVTTIDGVLDWIRLNGDGSALWERRWGLAVAAWKLAAYRPMLDQINAGTYPLPSHLTQQVAASKIAAKITRFQAQAETFDAQDVG